MATLPRKLQAALDAVRASADDGECSASLAELARPLGVSGRTMRRRLQRLEELGYLRIERLPGRPSIYRLTPKGQGLGGIGGLLLSWGARVLGSRGAPLSLRSPAPLLKQWGAEEILATLQENVAKRRPTLLVGPLGIGKSHILREFSAGAERCLYLEHISPIKPALLNLAGLLHQDGALEVEGIEANYYAGLWRIWKSG